MSVEIGPLLSITAELYRNKKLGYHRGTMRHAMLVNSCYNNSRGMGARKVSSSKGDRQGHSGHWQWCHSLGHIQFLIRLPLQQCLSCTVTEILSLISQNLNRSRDPEIPNTSFSR